MTGYLTADELQAALVVLHDKAPYAIQGVSTGFFSVARHYGGAVFNGCGYTYLPATDELVRDDVLKMVRKMRKKPPAINTQASIDLTQANAETKGQT